MKNISPMMAQTWKETIDITRMTNQNVKDNVRFAGKEKYPDNVMVWVVISKPLIRRSKSEAVN